MRRIYTSSGHRVSIYSLGFGGGVAIITLLLKKPHQIPVFLGKSAQRNKTKKKPHCTMNEEQYIKQERERLKATNGNFLKENTQENENYTLEDLVLIFVVQYFF